MEEILRGYKVDEGTWFYLSLPLIVAVYFRFRRFFSLRNIDLALLLAISPGILLVRHQSESLGYTILFIVSGLLLLRLFSDAWFTRRPRLEQNLNVEGLAVLCVSAIGFLAVAVWSADRIPIEVVETADRMLKRQEAPPPVHGHPDDTQTGPTATVLAAPVVKMAEKVNDAVGTVSPAPAPGFWPQRRQFETYAARVLSLAAHLAVVFGLFFHGRWNFDDSKIGVAMATLYLLLPCTSYDVGRLNHVLPAALILWSLATYRRPAVAGGLMGLACGTVFFPVFLLPLWLAFYDRRGAVRFAIALAAVGAVLVGSLLLTSVDVNGLRTQAIGSIDWSALSFHDENAGGFWRPDLSIYRIPVFVAFCICVVALAIWPRKKTFEHLLANSAAVIVGTQFWYPQRGGVYALWYLPLLLVVVFRPALSHLARPDFTPKDSLDRSSDHGLSRELQLAGSASATSSMRLR